MENITKIKKLTEKQNKILDMMDLSQNKQEIEELRKKASDISFQKSQLRLQGKTAFSQVLNIQLETGDII